MKTILSPAVAVVVFLFPLLTFAHGGGKHVMGTVKAVEDKGLTVETTDKKEVKVTIDASTKVEKAGAPASLKDLNAGDRVVVHTAKPDKSGILKAVLVKFGAPTAAAHPAGHDHHGDSPKVQEKAP
jgi:hypothetical protein